MSNLYFHLYSVLLYDIYLVLNPFCHLNKQTLRLSVYPVKTNTPSGQLDTPGFKQTTWLETFLQKALLPLYVSRLLPYNTLIPTFDKGILEYFVTSDECLCSKIQCNHLSLKVLKIYVPSLF